MDWSVVLRPVLAPYASQAASLNEIPSVALWEGARLESGGLGIESLFYRGAFFSVESYQWLRNWYFGGCPARRLVR